MWLPVREVPDVEADIDGVLTFPVVSMSTAGNYRCAAKSEAGSFLADVVVNVERAAPEVFDMMAPESVTEGDNFTIQCTIMNWDEEVEFVFEGISLNSDPESRYTMQTYPVEESIKQAYLTVQKATLEDAGTYKCIAGPQASSSIYVEISKRPGEVVDLVVSPVIEGQDFFISCTIRNWFDEVRFYHNGNILSEDIDPRYSVYAPDPSLEDVTHVLKVTSARPEDEGFYQCYLDDHTSHTIEVSVKSPKAEVLDLSATAAVVGHNFNISCIVRNWNDQVTFIFNNVVVDPDKDWQYDVFVYPSSSDNHEETHILRVSDATLEDSGLYECYTTPDASMSAFITVWNDADVTLELQSLDQPNWRDSPIPINCKVEGVDSNTVTVLFSHYDDPQVSIQNRTKMSTSSHLVNIAISQGEEGSVPFTIFTLGFYSLSLDLKGLWSCEVFTPTGDSLGSDTMYLEIAEPPMFVNTPPEEVYEDDGADLYLNCSASGSRETMVAWYRKGIPEPIVFGRMRAMLFIPRFTNTDEGSYYCRAALHDREIQANTILKLRTPQPRVESVVASPAVVGGEFTVSCTVSNWRGEVLFTHNSEPADLEEGTRYTLNQQRRRGYRDWHTTTHILTISDATLQDSGVFECFLTPDIFSSTSVVVKENYGLLPTPMTIEEFNLPKPTLSSGRIVELRGPVTLEEGLTLLLTCLVSPVVQQDIVLIHDVFLLHVGEIKITEDPRIEVVGDISTDGSRLLYLRITEVTQEDGGEYQCATSTDPPAHSSLIVNIVPPGTQTKLPEATKTKAPYLVTTPENEGSANDFSHSFEDTCVFPHKWIGAWYQTDNNQKIIITAKSFGKSTCITALHNNYLLHHSRKDCFRCIQVTEKHPNLLQYKKSKCKKTHNIDVVCSNLTEDSHLQSMIRLDAVTSHCPFTGPRKFTFELPQGECSESLSKIISSKETELEFQFASCETLLSGFEFEAKTEKFECVANWKDGTTHYLISKLEGNSLSLEERYRCFTYTQEKNKNHVYHMIHSNTARCEFSEDFNKALKIFDVIEEKPLVLSGSTETELTVQPSDQVTLTCRASVFIDFDEEYFFRKYYMKWTHEVDGEVEDVTSDEDVMHIDLSRISLEIAADDFANSTKYDLVINPVQLNDAGVYTCILSSEDDTLVTRKIFLSMDDPPKYDSCELPGHWTGDWWTADEEYTITGNNFGKTICTVSLGNKFLMKEKSDCHTCFIIREKHHNILHFRKSSCTESEDLNTVCSLIENDDPVIIMVRKNSYVTCPFTGSRSFTYQLQHEECSQRPSKLTSLNNDTRLLFSYNPCLDQADPNVQPYHESRYVDCVARWSENSTHFLIGKLEKLLNLEEQYHCYAYEEVMNEDHIYRMSQRGSEICGYLGQSSDVTYKVFGQSKAPGPPLIEETEASRQVVVGESIKLTCTSSGGFPPATLKWFRDNEELPSETQQMEGTSKAYLDIVVDEADRTAEYHCQASNFATPIPLNTSTNLTFRRDYWNIMLPQVVAIEDEAVFLPCVQTSEWDLKMDWYDADLDLHITSGNETLSQDANYHAYINDGIMGLMVTSSFLDTTFGCTVEGEKLGNTTLVILPRYLLKEEFQDTPVQFEETETRLLVDKEGSVTMECRLSGNITSAVVSWWRYPESSLLTQGSVNLVKAEGYRLNVSGNSYQLTVTDANLTHSGSYVCQVAFSELEILRKNFTLNVEGQLWVELGQNTDVRCYSSTGEWVKFVHNEEDILQSNASETKKYELERSLEPDSKGAIFTLSIINTTEEDLGTYACIDIEDPYYIRQETTLKIFQKGESVTTNMSALDQDVKTLRPSESSEYETSGEEIGINEGVRKEEIPKEEEEYISEESNTKLITTTPPPTYEEVTLSCSGYNPSDITWKQNGNLLFLGQLDVGGIPGLSLMSNGDLVLARGPYKDIRDNDTYTCYVEAAFDDVVVATYNISLRGEDTIVNKRSYGLDGGTLESTPEPIPSPDFQFSGLKGKEFAVLANSKRIGNRILEVLQNGGLNTRLLEKTGCRAPNETRNWSGAQEALEECENQARLSKELESDQNVFMGIDFFVEIAPSSWFAVTQLYVHNVKQNVSVNVYAPMVPVPIGDIIHTSKADEPVLILVSESWWDTVQGVDSSYGNALTASILSLQESYLNLLNGGAST
ncbi:uncharacterized protein [Panulirus ornatus]